MAPKPPTIQRQAQGMLNPVIAALTKAANNRARLAEKAISGYTNSYANQLGQINAGAPYGAAESGQAAVDAALQQSLSGAGGDLASQLAARLAALQGSSGAAAVGQQAQDLASRGNANATTQVASGSSSLAQLLANQADAASYSKKLPGLAKLSGLQGLKAAQQQAQQTIDAGTLQAEQQLPSIAQSIQSQNSLNAYRGAELAQGNARLQIEQQNANTAAERAAQSAYNSDRGYKLALARLGIEQQRAQLEALKQEALLQGGGLSASELSRYKAIAYSGATSAFSTAGVTYKQAMVEITAKGVPPSMAAKALAAAGFKAGVRGAPGGVTVVGGGGTNKAPAGPLGPVGLGGLGKAYRKAGGSPFVATEPMAYRGSAETVAGRTIVSMAHQFIGTPYVWGGESTKGFDCSGFAQYLYSHAGINIPRTTYTQWTAANGRPVPMSQLLPGDLVFYKGGDSIVQNGRVLPGHVGIYIGHGKIIDAYGTGYGVRIDNVNMPGYMGARRYGKG